MRQNKRTFPTRANIGGSENRMHERLNRRATSVGALHEVNPPGSKALRRVRRRFLHGTLSVYQRILAWRHRRDGNMKMKQYFKQFSYGRVG